MTERYQTDRRKRVCDYVLLVLANSEPDHLVAIEARTVLTMRAKALGYKGPRGMPQADGYLREAIDELYTDNERALIRAEREIHGICCSWFHQLQREEAQARVDELQDTIVKLEARIVGGDDD